ncbi:hypothetical protein [Oxynema aestuarii]|jgi:hypothetical protein|uniref:HNH domain-containing protein n=1 Tax=Oxynema aestuarii AP17 TaxID=2064643 RepID=A0A6H1U381_9CYAN|nr:hypothetical protein [Oxynema aestuarii]QIZ72827.1 hypothetical protein HCG48_21325 [Oxynema aestuarii AP17]RMH72332.1 MAG: hypothetical protein D6680_19465 [Cyanobacteria bacterium J007]
MEPNRREKFGLCPLCQRECYLTFHHLIPRKVHRREFFKKNYSKDELNRGLDICRLCHNGIHDLYDEMTLAKEFASLDLLLADRGLSKHFEWVAKQKIRKPRNRS